LFEILVLFKMFSFWSNRFLTKGVKGDLWA